MNRIIRYFVIRLYTLWLRPRFAHLGKGAHIGWRAMNLKGLK